MDEIGTPGAKDHLQDIRKYLVVAPVYVICAVLVLNVKSLLGFIFCTTEPTSIVRKMFVVNGIDVLDDAQTSVHDGLHCDSVVHLICFCHCNIPDVSTQPAVFHVKLAPTAIPEL